MQLIMRVSCFIVSASLVAAQPQTSNLCDACGSSASYSETIATDSNLQKRTITASGCPNHYSVCTGKSGVAACGAVGAEGTATEATFRDKTIEIPAAPVFASSITDLECTLGEIATALNGVSIYSGAVDNACTQLEVENTMSEWTGFDMCSGHAQQDGDYHYHFPPSCLHHQAIKTNPTSTGHSPQLGWAHDGFPIYGPLYTGGVYLTAEDVDECSGKEEELPEIDSFKYRYYLTGHISDLYALPTNPKPNTSHYPFSIKCYKGCTWSALKAGTCASTGSGVGSSYTAAPLDGYTTPFAEYGSSGTNYAGDTYTSSFLAGGQCYSDGLPTSPSPSLPPPPAPPAIPSLAPASPPVSPDTDSGGDGLSDGAIAGIVIGSVAAAIATGVVVAYFVLQYKAPTVKNVEMTTSATTADKV